MVNYQNSIIYKICCRDVTIKDIYIGSTTNFNRRKQGHKQRCITHNYKIYQFIRENGGWENWDMVLIENYSCNNKLELEKKERENIEKYNSKLNGKIPTRTLTEFYKTDERKVQKHKTYIKNKDDILNKAKQKYTCQCGSILSIRNKSQHEQTTKHKNFLNTV